MEEPFAIIPIGVIKDCLEILDLSERKVKKEKPSEMKIFLQRFAQANRLLKELPKSPKKEYFRWCLTSKHDVMGWEYTYLMTLNSKTFELSESIQLKNSKDRYYECSFNKGVNEITVEQFEKAELWIKNVYNDLIKPNQDNVSFRFRLSYQGKE